MKQTVELQKFLANRLYEKIDYHKTNRIRIPIVVAVGNFTLLKLVEDVQNEKYLYLIAFTMIVVGTLGVLVMLTINKFFERNVKDLNYLYKQMGLLNEKYVNYERKERDGECSDEIAEQAEPIWFWLILLVFISGIIPVILLFVPQGLRCTSL